MTETVFRDRTDAGRQLASLLVAHDVEVDVVLAIPRGGVPIGRIVADRLGAPLDVIVAKKIGAPWNRELAIGAVASDGTVWLDEDIIDRFDISESYVTRQREREAEAARSALATYRHDVHGPDLDRARVLIVDDGVATGATAIACIRQVRAAGADVVMLAVPVGSPATVEALHSEADEVFAVETPPYFSAVGQFYESFRQVSDDEAAALLKG